MPASPPSDDSGLMTTREAARWLGVSERTVQRLRDAGDLPYLRMAGRTIRYRREALERWAADRETTDGGAT